MTNKNYSNSITGAAGLLCVSPDTIQAMLDNRDRISELELEVNRLKSTLEKDKETVDNIRKIVDDAFELYGNRIS